MAGPAPRRGAGRRTYLRTRSRPVPARHGTGAHPWGGCAGMGCRWQFVCRIRHGAARDNARPCVRSRGRRGPRNPGARCEFQPTHGAGSRSRRRLSAHRADGRNGEVRQERVGRDHRRHPPGSRRHRTHHGGGVPTAVLLDRRLVHWHHRDERGHPHVCDRRHRQIQLQRCRFFGHAFRPFPGGNRLRHHGSGQRGGRARTQIPGIGAVAVHRPRCAAGLRRDHHRVPVVPPGRPGGLRCNPGPVVLGQGHGQWICDRRTRWKA